MTWPTWVDELKDRYLDEEASAFLVVGDIHAKRWEVEGEPLDAANVLVRLFARTRPVVGVLRTGMAGALRFPTFSEEKKFDELVEAALLLSGKALALSSREPVPAMGRIWLALTTRGTDQAYMVVDADALAPARKKRLDPIPGAPPLFEWASHPTLRRSNNVLVFLVSDAASLRPEFVASCAVIRLDGAPAVDAAALQHVADDVVEPVAPQESGGPTATDVVPVRASDDAVAALQEELHLALTASLIAHPEDHRAAKIPVMEAVAVVLARHGAAAEGIGFDLDEEGKVLATGEGGDAFLALWRSDIALDASAGMLLKALPSSFSAASPPQLDETAIRALAKRVAKRLV